MRIRYETVLLIICAILFLAGLTKAASVQNFDKAGHGIFPPPETAQKAQKAGKFDGQWFVEQTRSGQLFSLAVTIREENGKLTGEYYNVSSKESTGAILSSKIAGNTATIEIDCDWGGTGTVRLTRLKGNRLHWQVIKRNERKGEFIVLVDRILTRK